MILQAEDRDVSAPETKRLKIALRGAVQGVGFRPFVYRLAGDLGLKGWVTNSSQGVQVEVEGPAEDLEAFLLRLEQDKPPRASIQSLESVWLDAVGFDGFAIRPSTAGERTATVMPDIATCPDCRREILDPNNRRYRYPFTNCTHCGPRYSILEALPYDRSNTTMRGFVMCPACEAEYADPSNRRFHAQPNACPVCGPHLEFWDAQGQALAIQDPALRLAANAVREGRILALKGLGGFQLLVDARQEEAVARLRQRKHREEKPLALMFPSLDSVKAHCQVSDLEERLLRSPEAPIVLLARNDCALRTSEILNPKSEEIVQKKLVADAVAPGNPQLGAMLPYTPLHHLLMAELGFPVVATSGNLSDEPICLDEQEALDRLGGIADVFLVHNRPIVRQVDDSVVRVMMGRELVLRRARGYAPLPFQVRTQLPAVLATGAQLKNTVAIAVDSQVFVSQHIGDLETAEAYQAFQKIITSLKQLYAHEPTVIACDAHPDYASTRFARQSGLPMIPVQHHLAHVLACMAENELDPPVLGVAWDGTGYGTDGTIWGGEFLSVTTDTFHRQATFRSFRLPGGDKAVQEPRRVALAMLYEILGAEAFQLRDLPTLQAFSDAELGVLVTMLDKKVNAPVTTSAGRIFDAVASLAGRRQILRYEGQAAMELEWALAGFNGGPAYPISVRRGDPGANQADEIDQDILSSRQTMQTALMVIDWEPMVWAILDDVRCRVPVGRISARFHQTLVEAIVAVAGLVGEERVVLTGGCFQNRFLTEHAVQRLSQEGFRPYWHQRLPPNDGGIALGQAMAAAREPRRF